MGPGSRWVSERGREPESTCLSNMLRSAIPRGPWTPRSTWRRPGAPSPGQRARPDPEPAPGPRGGPARVPARRLRRSGPGRRRGGRRPGWAAGPPLPHAATDPRHSAPSAAAPGRVGRGRPAAGLRAGDGPRRVPGRPGRSHSGWLISKRWGHPPPGRRRGCRAAPTRPDTHAYGDGRRAGRRAASAACRRAGPLRPGGHGGRGPRIARESGVSVPRSAYAFDGTHLESMLRRLDDIPRRVQSPTRSAGKPRRSSDDAHWQVGITDDRRGGLAQRGSCRRHNTVRSQRSLAWGIGRRCPRHPGLGRRPSAPRPGARRLWPERSGH
jgi:hypothetical protein